MLPVNLDGQEIVAKSTAHGIAIAAGPNVPADGAKGYAPGCWYHKLSASPPSRDALHVNVGNQNSAAFKAVSCAAKGEPLLLTGELFSGVPGSTQTIETGDTVVTTPAIPIGPLKLVGNDGNVTGVKLALGTPGQEISVANLGSGSITFAVSGTSNVADGANVVIGSLRVTRFQFIGSLWYAFK